MQQRDKLELDIPNYANNSSIYQVWGTHPVFLEPHCSSFQTAYIYTLYFQVVIFEMVHEKIYLQLENILWTYMLSENCRSVVLKTLGVFPTLDIFELIRIVWDMWL